MAKNICPGDLVAHRDKTDELYVVIDHTYRVSRWGNRRLILLFCTTTGEKKYILEEQLVLIKSKKTLDF